MSGQASSSWLVVALLSLSLDHTAIQIFCTGEGVSAAKPSGAMALTQFHHRGEDCDEKDQGGGHELNPGEAFLEDEAVGQERIYDVDIADEADEA
mmetsp:Transcript_2371/g.3268  ORF Transcript_2371/g.3268 Transcript_2371/m.3268 type:complete len:95 (-) Transcript_2371:945-1229(-)